MSAHSWRNWSALRRITVAVLAAAVAWDLLALVRLWRDDDTLMVAPLSIPPIANVSRRPVDDPQVYSLAAARAPFNGGAPVPLTTQAFTITSPATERPRLTGTVVQGTNSFVVVELPDGSMRLVRVGERAAGLTLRSVTPGVATFADSTGQRVVLRAAQLELGARP